jgi:hypothetical protein
MLRRGAIRLSLAAGLLIGLADLSRADTIYIEGTTNDTLATLNPTTGAVQVIGSTSGILMGGLGFGANGVLYGIDASKNLYSINTSTGAATLLGSTGIPAGGDYALGATSDGTLYAQTSGELYLVNPTTHLGTLLGPLGFNTNADVNGDGSNNLYILNNNGSAGLYGVNKSNGQTTLIGTGSAGDVVGLAFADGTMYAMGYGGTTGVYSVSLTTGQDTLVSNYDTSQIGGIYTAATQFTSAAVPEPSALLLLSAGILPLAYAWASRRRKR